MTIYAIIIATLTFGAIFSVLTLSLNLQYARGGMINFGTVAYFAAGAYAYAIFTQEPPSGLDQYRFGFDMPWYVGFLAAGVASLLFALVTGWPTLRLRGEYLALTTFAFAEVFHSLLLNERRIGNGSVGLANVERPDPTTLGMSDTVGYALAAVVLMLVTAFVFNRLLKSPFGRTIDAVHDDEIAAQAVGKDDARIRLQVFIISAIPIGFAGALYAMITTLVAPAMFTAEVTFLFGSPSCLLVKRQSLVRF
ncbi:branched-chain amino acid ABC transporter permease [Yoonia vestfoldensis]|uniref:Branched-chain amino acid ABC transporter permease n=1 Tax=Yoonia vestfoldensis TaxID=245188 RepID=A0A1Y0EGT1_9RHOB|nr:branched-chain amino acid ABC transporter permease [Yoonia vestfoldensis]ARU02502.1 branched-chain amino acid ABC transporter permease [Yoonia vestfoldensis]